MKRIGEGVTDYVHHRLNLNSLAHTHAKALGLYYYVNINRNNNAVIYEGSYIEHKILLVLYLL